MGTWWRNRSGSAAPNFTTATTSWERSLNDGSSWSNYSGVPDSAEDSKIILRASSTLTFDPADTTEEAPFLCGTLELMANSRVSPPSGGNGANGADGTDLRGDHYWLKITQQLLDHNTVSGYGLVSSNGGTPVNGTDAIAFGEEGAGPGVDGGDGGWGSNLHVRLDIADAETISMVGRVQNGNTTSAGADGANAEGPPANGVFTINAHVGVSSSFVLSGFDGNMDPFVTASIATNASAAAVKSAIDEVNLNSFITLVTRSALSGSNVYGQWALNVHADSGTYDLSYRAGAPQNVDWNASAATLKTKIEAATGLTVTVTLGSTSTGTKPVQTITFTGVTSGVWALGDANGLEWNIPTADLATALGAAGYAVTSVTGTPGVVYVVTYNDYTMTDELTFDPGNLDGGSDSVFVAGTAPNREYTIDLNSYSAIDLLTIDSSAANGSVEHTRPVDGSSQYYNFVVTFGDNIDHAPHIEQFGPDLVTLYENVSGGDATVYSGGEGGAPGVAGDLDFLASTSATGAEGSGGGPGSRLTRSRR